MSIDSKRTIEKAIHDFPESSLYDASIAFFEGLGYSSHRHLRLESHSPKQFLAQFAKDRSLNEKYAKTSEWNAIEFLFQLTDDDIRGRTTQQYMFESGEPYDGADIRSYLVFALELKGPRYSRTALADITREINKLFSMPGLILFRYGAALTLAIIGRRMHRRDSTKDVLEKVTLIKDINLEKTHRAHIEILHDMSLPALQQRHECQNFVQLQRAWEKTLNTQELNKRFYKDLQCWYLWALKQIDFPRGGGENDEIRNSVGVIRMLTRLIFVWFNKEGGIVPDDLFEPRLLKKYLKQAPDEHPDDCGYYLAILQNLFFATLNVEMGTERKWAASGGGMKGDRLIHTLYRHQNLFNQPDEALSLFADIPFLNGGLFECLDRELTERDLAHFPELAKLANKEGSGLVLRVDGFSRRKDAQPHIPNKIFFGGEEKVDLNTELGTKGKRQDVKGLIDILSAYKFTVDENTPLEEEVALDPELLGKVFENLLASYNEETKTTARKLSGSFYTPREVVDFMVEEALVAYLAPKLPEKEDALRHLVSYEGYALPFSPKETQLLVSAIEQLRVVDPACGSGAFLMGMLAKLVETLKKLDPENELWRSQNRQRLENACKEAAAIADPQLREERMESAERELEKFDHDFADHRHADYSRKLYLIEKCIHGVDIQPIAVQIAKLRFFISLVVSQEPDPAKPNRGITALPNLETKIVAANTLREALGQRELRWEIISEKEVELAAANNSYFAARTTRTKRKWRDRIFALRDELAHLLEQDQGLDGAVASQLVHWNPFDQNAAADFFDPEWMFQLADGFDICIGNPPYVRQEKIKGIKDTLKHYECFVSSADLLVYFIERGIKLLKPGGAFAFITSNKWYRAKYGEKLRKWLNSNAELLGVIDFGDAAVFEAIAYPTILIARRRKSYTFEPLVEDQVLALNWDPKWGKPDETFPEVYANHAFKVPQQSLKSSGWQLEPPAKRELLERIRKAGVPLGEYVKGRFYRGILTGLNEAFVIDGATRQRLIDEDPKSEEIIKPFLRGRDVKRWRVDFQEQYLIRIESSENKAHPWSDTGDKAEDVFAKCYPAIHHHFQAYRQGLINRHDQGRFFWELRACAYWQEFEQPKIFVPAIERGVNYAPDLDGFYGNDKTNIVVTDNWRYILAILNSTVSWWLTQQNFSSKQGGYYEFKPMYVEKLPIPSVSDKERSIIEPLITAVLLTTDPLFERLINGLIYELYFSDDLHAANIYLFDELEKTNLSDLASFEGADLEHAAQTLAATLFANTHPIYRMLFDLQALPFVRIIEGAE